MPKARATLEQGRHRNRGSEELWLASVRTEQRAGLPKAADALMAKALQVPCCCCLPLVHAPCYAPCWRRPESLSPLALLPSACCHPIVSQTVAMHMQPSSAGGLLQDSASKLAPGCGT